MIWLVDALCLPLFDYIARQKYHCMIVFFRLLVSLNDDITSSCTRKKR
nr:MAG TPA: hypothetical protein [Caudoviricetes sp.]DAS08869.1 MAG TPA: hypothetical protein [Caudoviricetes sp.]